MSPVRLTPRPVKWEQYNTFISHKSTDIEPAQYVAKMLAELGLVSYLDRWDPQVTGDSPDLEDYLRDVIRSTSSLMTLVSQTTGTSWWVPFEVGVARETNSVIATYLLVNESGPPIYLPSYLKKWPIIGDPAELREWALQYKSSLSLQPSQRRTLMEGTVQLSAQSRNRVFHDLEDRRRLIFVE